MRSMAWERSHRKRFVGRRSDVATNVAMTIIEAVAGPRPGCRAPAGAEATSGDHRIFPRIVDRADTVPTTVGIFVHGRATAPERLIDEP
jgi:hypothetical protein